MRASPRRLAHAIAATVLTASCVSPVWSETLEQVYTLARDNDALLKSQAAQAAANRETANIYRGALLPQANFTRTTSDADYKIGGSSCRNAGGRCNNTDIDSDKDTVNVSQTLFNVEQWYDFQRGKKVSEQADAQYAAHELDLMVRTTEAYVNVLRTIDAYETALAQEQAIARQLEQAKQRFDVGLIAITDVHEAQAQFDIAHVQTLNTQGMVGIAFEAVQVLTGQPLETIAPLSDELPIKMPEPAAQAEWEALALAKNPDLAVSALAVEAARNNTKARRAGHLPTLTGTYQHNNGETTTNYHPTRLNDDQQGNVVAINFTMPLSSGGTVSALRRQAYQQQMASEEGHTNLTRNAVQQVRSYHLAVNTDIQRVAADKQAIVSAQSALDATRAGYEVGTRNIVDVLDAEQRLYQAKYAHSSARYQYIIDVLRLLQTAGTLSMDNLARFSQFLLADKSLSRSSYALSQ